MGKPKKYNIRVYAMDKSQTLILNDAVETNMLGLTRRFNGLNGCDHIFDGFVSEDGLKMLISLGLMYFPFNHYEDFIITCPNCHERIDDDMILLVYDENVLSGYNICCGRYDCGVQMADVEFLKD